MSFLTENDVWKLIKAELAIWETGYPDSVVVKRGFEPTQQKTPVNFFAFIFQINNHRYGAQGHSDKFNPIDNQIDHTERYIINKTLQISTQAITDLDAERTSGDVAERTSGDVAESIAAHLGSQLVIQRLKTQGLGIFRITDVRHPHFDNDVDRYEADPSFDFVLSYTQEIESVGIAVDNINGVVTDTCSLPPPV